MFQQSQSSAVRIVKVRLQSLQGWFRHGTFGTFTINVSRLHSLCIASIHSSARSRRFNLRFIRSYGRL
jgi:hypothetical protein